METIRAFVALDLSLEARAVLAEVSDTLAAKTPREAVKWTLPDNIHLTIKFLGNTPVDRLQEIYEALDRVAAAHEPFTLYLDRLGCFPNQRRPRVIWVGVQGDTAQVEALHLKIDETMERMGWERERRSFHPHLTVGRVKDAQANLDLPWGKGVAPAPINVGSIHLFESQLRRSGPIYTVRHSSPLGNRE